MRYNLLPRQVASQLADEYLAEVCGPAYEGWGFGLRKCEIKSGPSGYCWVFAFTTY